jgi:hypothetical protein
LGKWQVQAIGGAVVGLSAYVAQRLGDRCPLTWGAAAVLVPTSLALVTIAAFGLAIAMGWSIAV